MARYSVDETPGRDLSDLLMLQRLNSFAAPALTAVLLVSMSTMDKLRIDPHEADAFHTRAAAVIAAVPRLFEIGPHSWFARKDLPLGDDAEGMLKPNAYLHRIYQNPVNGRQVELLLVQCRDSRDMQGHYPPVCYPSNGCQMNLPGEARDSVIQWPGRKIMVPSREYSVVFPGGRRRTIRNFFVMPNGQIVRDMESVNRSAKDYRELVFGVAQIQLLFDGSVDAPACEQIFTELLGANPELITTLQSGIPGSTVKGPMTMHGGNG
jgi:hypothetical protein